MKKIIFSVLAFATFLVSCSSNSDLVAVSGSTAASVAAYVSQNYPDTKIVTTAVVGSTVLATLNTGETLSFTKDGSLISYANNAKAGIAADSLIIPTDTLPGDSLKPGHDGDGHGRGHGGPGDHGKPGEGPGHGGPGPQGPADSTHVGGNPGHGHGHERHFKNEISVDSLSSAINVYISTNYVSYKVIHAEVDTICQGVVTEVLVCTTSSEPVKLIFDAAGTYLMKGERSLYSDVPTAVSDAVTANYSTYKVMKRAEKFTLPDGSVLYKVFMELDKTHKLVTFNSDGSVVCEK